MPLPESVKVPLTVKLPAIVAFSSTVSASVFTVPSKKASLYCNAVVPKSTALVVLGLRAAAVATMSCDGPVSYTHLTLPTKA